MERYASLTRTAWADLPDVQLPNAGVYVIAYMGRVVYVGKAEGGVAGRLAGHWYAAGGLPFDAWLRRVDDTENIRVDVLEDPGADGWCRRAEAALIHRFRPLFNERLNH